MSVANNASSGRTKEEILHPWLMRSDDYTVSLMSVGVFGNGAASGLSIEQYRVDINLIFHTFCETRLCLYVRFFNCAFFKKSQD